MVKTTSCEFRLKKKNVWIDETRTVQDVKIIVAKPHPSTGGGGPAEIGRGNLAARIYIFFFSRDLRIYIKIELDRK